MKRGISIALAASFGLAVAGLAPAASAAGTLKVVSVKTIGGFKYPESVGCDARDQVLYMSQFGSVLKPTLKDGKGKISKLSLDGKVLEDHVFPPAGEVLNKPKGVWVEGDHLWTTDIDSVWEFNLRTGKGQKVALPGAKFANDPTVDGNTLYVSDNRGDQLFRVSPADFMGAGGEPTVTVVFQGKSVNPNGLFPGKDGSLLMDGYDGKTPRPVFALSPSGKITAVTEPIGRLDGLYQLADGSLIVSDWVSGTVFHWSKHGGRQTLASGFKGPADLCVMPQGNGLLLVVPDLVKSEIRIIKLSM